MLQYCQGMPVKDRDPSMSCKHKPRCVYFKGLGTSLFQQIQDILSASTGLITLAVADRWMLSLSMIIPWLEVWEAWC